MRRKVYEKMLIPLIADFFRSKGYIVFTEQYVGFRRADVLAVRLNDEEVKKRISHGVKHIPSKTFFRIMRLLNKYDELSISELAKKLRLSSKYVMNIVSIVNPLYLYKEGEKVRKIREYKPYVTEIIGIEAKIKDWKYGLVQAHQYLYAVDKSYLAVHAMTIDKLPEKVIEWIKEKGIGLLVVHEKRGVEEIIKAKKSGPLSQTAYFSLAESLWDKVLRMLDHLSI